MIRTAKCIGVDGDEEGFSDLIGNTGKLRIDPESKDPAVNWFDDGGGSVNFALDRFTEVNDRIDVFTRLGNTFKFRVIQVGAD